MPCLIRERYAHRKRLFPEIFPYLILTSNMTRSALSEEKGEEKPESISSDTRGQKQCFPANSV